MSRDVAAERKARNLIQSFLEDEGLGEQLRIQKIVDRGLTGLSIEMSTSTLLEASDLEIREWAHRIGNHIKSQMAKPASVHFQGLEDEALFEMETQDFKHALLFFGIFMIASLSGLYFLRHKKVSRFKIVKDELLSREI